MSGRHRRTMEEHISRLEYQLVRVIERCQIAEEKLSHVSHLIAYGIEHPPSRYMHDASGSQPPMPRYVPSRSIDNAKRIAYTPNNQAVQPVQQAQQQQQPQPQPQNTHIFFE